jgi:hypothetical protein
MTVFPSRPGIALSLAALIALAACGQKDNVTPHSQPAPQGESAAPKPLVGEPQTPPAGGTPVFSGNAPVSPGGAVEPGQGRSPDRPPSRDGYRYSRLPQQVFTSLR